MIISEKTIDETTFQVTYGCNYQNEIFEAIAQHIRREQHTVETMELFTGTERYMATVQYNKL